MTIFNNLSRKERTALLLCLAVWANGPIFSFIFTAIYKVTGSTDVPSVFFTILFIILALYALPNFKGKRGQKGVLFYVVFTLYYLISLVSHNENTFLQENATRILFTILPVYFVGQITDAETLYKPLKIVSIIALVTQSIYIFYVAGFAQSLEGITDFMTQSYQLLPCALFLALVAVKEKTITTISLALYSVVLLFAMGTRGPFLLYLIFFGILFIANFNKIAVKYKIGGVILMLVAFWGVDSILSLGNNWAIYLGGSTRIFDIYKENEFLQDASSLDRLSLYDTAFSALEGQGILGLGLAGDRMVLGGYVHNFLFELIISFGWILGIVLFLVTCIYVAKSYFRSIEGEREMLLILLTVGLLCLFLSNSYLENYWFFYMLGYAYRINENYRERCQSQVN